MRTPPKLTSQGAEFIGAFEGFVAAPYNDAGTPPNATIGFGHLLHRGPVTQADRRRWGTITRAQAARLLQADAHAALLGIERHIAIALRPAQVAALCSFAYNCGADSLAGNVGRAVNAKPKLWQRTPARMRAWKQQVAAAMGEWDHAGGAVLEGLRDRRRAEAVLFATGRYTRAAGNPYAHA